MLEVPSDNKKLIPWINDLIQKCRTSAGTRASYCRIINSIIETGRPDGTRSLINLLHDHVDRLAAHLYSPTELRFTIDFEAQYPENVMNQGAVVARALTRDWERSNTDMLFGRGVREAVDYGACILKQWVQEEGENKTPVYQKRLVMPWNFGVYREDENELGKQSAMVETVTLSMPEVWRRIHHLPNANDLFRRVKSNAGTAGPRDEPASYFHQVLSTSQINTSGQQSTMPIPGGIVGLGNDSSFQMMGPEVTVDTARMHEVWIQGEKDYVTIQVIEPDILITPYKRSNILIPGQMESGLHPYTLIQCNEVTGYIWGRPEIVDMIAPQGFLSMVCDDVRRLFGLQVDKLLAFPGDDSLTDERYDQFRTAGFVGLQAGASVTDLTPKFPDQALPLIEMLIKIINMMGGFPDIMQGKGEAGVRAGVHADTLLKTASPRLRDRALLIERQCASAADTRLSIMEAKEGRNYWTDGTNVETIDKTSFLLSDIPEDRRVAVDSHSSSPIFAEDHRQNIAFGLKAGFVDGDYAIDHMNFPDADRLHKSLKDKRDHERKMMEALIAKDPEAAEKILAKKQGGGHR